MFKWRGGGEKKDSTNTECRIKLKMWKGKLAKSKIKINASNWQFHLPCHLSCTFGSLLNCSITLDCLKRQKSATVLTSTKVCRQGWIDATFLFLSQRSKKVLWGKAERERERELRTKIWKDSECFGVVKQIPSAYQAHLSNVILTLALVEITLTDRRRYHHLVPILMSNRQFADFLSVRS